jgi:hypothetical protein
MHGGQVDRRYYSAVRGFLPVFQFPMNVPKKKMKKRPFSLLFRLLAEWPNTYTYTKAVAENVIKKQADDLPVGIFRPAIGS